MAITRTGPRRGGPGEDPDVFVTDLLLPGPRRRRGPVRWAREQVSTWVVPEREPTRPLVPLRTGQLAALVVACAEHATEGTGRRDEAVIRLMSETGMHTHELLELQVDDVGIAQRCVVVRSGSRRRERLVPIGEHTARVLDAHLQTLADDPWLWPGSHGGPMSSYELLALLGSYAKRLGFRRLDADVLRLTAAVRWLQAGGTPGGFVTIAGWRHGDPIDRHTTPASVLNALDQAARLALDDY
ncbi:hypothetical protein GCM10027047_25640 [Rhodococcus aerolatus]